MRTSLNFRGGSRRRIVAIAAAAALPVGILAATMGPASAFVAPGSPGEVFIDTGASGAPADSIHSGWWGHEGGANNGTGTGTSFLDVDLAAVASTFPDLSKVGVAFVTSSADGSAERPAVTGTKSVDQVFPWFMDAGVETGLNGTTNANDSVALVSTGAEYDNWFSAGQPLQGFNNNLQLLDVSAPGQPVSSTPEGKSILNRWPAGSNISLVFYKTTGANVNGKPVVAVDGSGHAVTAYMPFVTSAKPGDALRTSAGYTDADFGAVQQTTTTTLTTSVASPQPKGTSVGLIATVAPASGTDVPVGSVEFFDGATSLGTAALSGGTATLPKVLPVGTHSLTAVYTPTNTNTLAFKTSTSSPAKSFVISQVTTTTAAGATPGADVTAPVSLTATVSPEPGVTGTVVWKDGGVTVAGPTAIDATSGIATATHTFSVPGAHTVTAIFTPDAASSDYTGSQGSVTFTLAAPSGVSTDTQTITATIPSGTLTMTTPYTPASPLDLGTLALTPGLDGYKNGVNGAGTTFKDIHIVDTRDGALPWHLTALAGNMTDGAATPHFINGENLGLTALAPETTDKNGAAVVSNPGTGTVTAFPFAVPTVPLAPGDTGSAGLGGTAKTVLSADHGPSNVWYSGTLTLFAPTTTVSGLYTGTITFTAS